MDIRTRVGDVESSKAIPSKRTVTDSHEFNDFFIN